MKIVNCKRWFSADQLEMNTVESSVSDPAGVDRHRSEFYLVSKAFKINQIKSIFFIFQFLLKIQPFQRTVWRIFSRVTHFIYLANLVKVLNELFVQIRIRIRTWQLMWILWIRTSNTVTLWVNKTDKISLLYSVYNIHMLFKNSVGTHLWHCPVHPSPHICNHGLK